MHLYIPKLLCICRCANKQNANSLGECQVPSNTINDNIAASVGDIHRSKELIDEYVY